MGKKNFNSFRRFERFVLFCFFVFAGGWQYNTCIKCMSLLYRFCFGEIGIYHQFIKLGFIYFNCGVDTDFEA
jgi:hypothetical protein